MAEQEKIKLLSFPIYLPEDKYIIFKAICKSKRTPMTKIAEQELDKFIAKNPITA